MGDNCGGVIIAPFEGRFDVKPGNINNSHFISLFPLLPRLVFFKYNGIGVLFGGWLVAIIGGFFEPIGVSLDC